MKIPDKIRIGGVDHLIKKVPDLIHEYKIAYGQIDYDSHEIRINPNLSDDQGQCQTLLHEMLHGLTRFLGMDKLNHDEDSIDKLANGLYMIIKDNPDMFKDV